MVAGCPGGVITPRSPSEASRLGLGLFRKRHLGLAGFGRDARFAFMAEVLEELTSGGRGRDASRKASRTGLLPGLTFIAHRAAVLPFLGALERVWPYPSARTPN